MYPVLPYSTEASNHVWRQGAAVNWLTIEAVMRLDLLMLDDAIILQYKISSTVSGGKMLMLWRQPGVASCMSFKFAQLFEDPGVDIQSQCTSLMQS